MILTYTNYWVSEVAKMKKEPYTRTEIEVIRFETEDVIMTSGDLIEENPGQTGGGVLVDP